MLKRHNAEVSKRIGFFVGAGVAVVLAGALASFRPPEKGNVYHSKTDENKQSESTFILLQSGDCLVLSQSKADIGRTEARYGSAGELFTIIGGSRVSSDVDGQGHFLFDRRSGHIARPGHAIDGVIIRRKTLGKLRDALDTGWPIDLRCGHRLGEVVTISRVHR